MPDLKWKDAIEKVLEEEKKTLHYTEIAELIAERGYRRSLGATPQDTVSAVLSVDIKNNPDQSPFLKVDKGLFILKRYMDNQVAVPNELEKYHAGSTSIDEAPPGYHLINSFGIYWRREKVLWRSNPQLLGVQQTGATEVDFTQQIGIYLLHDSREAIYVGQAIGQTLGERLRQHTNDRLNGRWDRFSWFGFYPVKDNGNLELELNHGAINLKMLGDVLEAVLIESLEPRQNRKQGNLFTGLEFLQREAPELSKKRKEQIIKEMMERL